MNPDDPVYNRKVLDLITVAHDYCLFMEKADEYPVNDILNYLQKVLPLLYLKGSLLPEVIPDNEDFAERFVMEEEWEALFNIISAKLGKNDIFYQIHPLDSLQDTPKKLSLAENCADIYQDLKDFLFLYQKNTYSAKENAVLQCFELFKTHWGIKITQMIPAIHLQIFGEKSPDDPYLESI